MSVVGSVPRRQCAAGFIDQSIPNKSRGEEYFRSLVGQQWKAILPQANSQKTGRPDSSGKPRLQFGAKRIGRLT
jgi:hypothetical protein